MGIGPFIKFPLFLRLYRDREQHGLDAHTGQTNDTNTGSVLPHRRNAGPAPEGQVPARADVICHRPYLHLYLSRMIQQGTLPECIVETYDAVASDAVPRSAIVAQIHYSSGVRMADAPAVLDAFAETFRNEFGDQARSVSVILPGLGNLSAIDADHAQYRLTIRDDTAVASASLNE